MLDTAAFASSKYMCPESMDETRINTYNDEMTSWASSHRAHRLSKKRLSKELPKNNTVFDQDSCTTSGSIDDAYIALLERELTKRRPDYLPADVDKTVHLDPRAMDLLLTAQERNCRSPNLDESETVTETETVKWQVVPGYIEQKANVVMWVSDICREENADYNVFPLAINYFNRMLDIQYIPIEQLKYLALGCVFLASKMKAPTPISAKRLAEYTNCYTSHKTVLKWETIVVDTLRWKFSVPTCFELFDQLLVRKKELHEMDTDFNWIAIHMHFDDELSRLLPSKQAALGIFYLCWDKEDLSSYRSLVYETFKLDFYDLKEHLQFLMPTITDDIFYRQMQGRLSTE
ncbi:Cyclin N-terminal domain-containing protein [Aphelenchoides besseyi]|nr:Cyclin N-terminal domain-containing protein [Aphelenchoides besseyi]